MILNESGFVVLDSSGNGTLRMRPDESHMHWLPTLASVKCSSSNNEAVCQIFAGAKPVQDNFVDGTFSGSSGDATDKITGYDIARNTQAPYVWAVWTGGDPGAQATMVLSGTKEIR